MDIEKTVLNIRGLDVEVKERMRLAAGARGITYAEYLRRLVESHGALLRFCEAEGMSTTIGSHLERHGLDPVRA